MQTHTQTDGSSEDILITKNVQGYRVQANQFQYSRHTKTDRDKQEATSEIRQNKTNRCKTEEQTKAESSRPEVHKQAG